MTPYERYLIFKFIAALIDYYLFNKDNALIVIRQAVNEQANEIKTQLGIDVE